MPLPVDEAGFRALEPKCASPHSLDSKRTVAQLSEQAEEYKQEFLWNAICDGLSNLVRCALEAKISANMRGMSALKRPVLVQAAYFGDTRIMKLLLDAGADHSQTDSRRFTALLLTAQEGHLDCIQLLLAAGADANKANFVGETPLMKAIVSKRADCARALLPASDLGLTTQAGMSAFHVCVVTASDECFELLLPHMPDVDVRTLQGIDGDGHTNSIFNQSALHLACHLGRQQMAKALLKRGADRMAKDSSQLTPLHSAAYSGHLSCVTLLIEQPGRRKMTPAEVDLVAMNGWTALHCGAQNSDIKICGFLLEAGARLDAKLPSGHTPLMVAQHFHPTNATLHALLSGAGPANLPGTVCDHCGKTAAQASVNSLKACSECHAVRYCGAACSAAAWKGHKKACRARAKEREEMAKPKFINS